MLDSRRSRALALILLASILTGFFVWYGTLTPNPTLGEYPSETELATDYAQYLTEDVVVSGKVISTEPVVIAARHGNDRLVLTITSLEGSVRPGEILRIYGVAGPNRTIRAVNAFSVPEHRLWYTYGISFLAGIWVLARIVQDWQFSQKTWALTPSSRETTPPRGDTDSEGKHVDA